MSELSLSDAELMDRLNAHPHLRRRMESILSAVIRFMRLQTLTCIGRSTNVRAAHVAHD